MAAELILFVTCAAIAVLAIFFCLPWMARVTSLYMLHTLRDKLFAVGRLFPRALETLSYRDVEFLLSYYIHVCRDLDAAEVRELMEMCFAGDNGDGPATDWRDPVYERELSEVYVGKRGAHAYHEIVAIFEQADRALMLRSLAYRPSALVLMLAFFWAVALRAFANELFEQPDSSARRISRKVGVVAGIAARPVAAAA